MTHRTGSDVRPEAPGTAYAAFVAAGARDIPADPAARAAWIVERGPAGLLDLVQRLHEHLAPGAAHTYRQDRVVAGMLFESDEYSEWQDVAEHMEWCATSVVAAIAADPTEAGLRRVGILASSMLCRIHPFNDGNGRISRALGFLLAAGPAHDRVFPELVSPTMSDAVWFGRHELVDTANDIAESENWRRVIEIGSRVHGLTPRECVDLLRVVNYQGTAPSSEPGAVQWGDDEFYRMVTKEPAGNIVLCAAALLLNGSLPPRPDWRAEDPKFNIVTIRAAFLAADPEAQRAVRALAYAMHQLPLELLADAMTTSSTYRSLFTDAEMSLHEAATQSAQQYLDAMGPAMDSSSLDPSRPPQVLGSESATR